STEPLDRASKSLLDKSMEKLRRTHKLDIARNAEVERESLRDEPLHRTASDSNGGTIKDVSFARLLELLSEILLEFACEHFDPLMAIQAQHGRTHNIMRW